MLILAKLKLQLRSSWSKRELLKCRKTEIYIEIKMFINKKKIQPESFSKEIVSLKCGKPITRISKVPRPDPFLIHLETVGGRLKQSLELYLEKNNLILVPNQQYIAKRLIFHFHEIVFLRTTYVTAGAIGAAGCWKQIVLYSICLRKVSWTSWQLCFSKDGKLDEERPTPIYQCQCRLFRTLGCCHASNTCCSASSNHFPSVLLTSAFIHLITSCVLFDECFNRVRESFIINNLYFVRI